MLDLGPSQPTGPDRAVAQTSVRATAARSSTTSAADGPQRDSRTFADEMAALDGGVDDAPQQDAETTAAGNVAAGSQPTAAALAEAVRSGLTAGRAVQGAPGKPVADDDHQSAGDASDDETDQASSAAAALLLVLAAFSAPTPPPVITGDLGGASPVPSQPNASETGHGDSAAKAFAHSAGDLLRAAMTPDLKARMAAVGAETGTPADLSTMTALESASAQTELPPGFLEVLRVRAALAARNATAIDGAKPGVAAEAAAQALADLTTAARNTEAATTNVDVSALRAYATATKSEGAGEAGKSAISVTETTAKAVAPVRNATVAFGFDGAPSGHRGETPVPTTSGASNFLATMATASDAASGLPADTVNQIVQAIRLQWNNGSSEARITLQPEQFGDVTVSIRVERGQVVARVEAEVPVVREWLQTNQATLRQGLAEHNLSLNRLEVAEPPESRDAERRGGQSFDEQPQRRHQRQPADEDAFEVVA